MHKNLKINKRNRIFKHNIIMKDYTEDINFWQRLQDFISDVKTNDCMSEEEKEMILYNCKLRILEIRKKKETSESLAEWLKNHRKHN